jgi:hypothetical protein
MSTSSDKPAPPDDDAIESESDAMSDDLADIFGLETDEGSEQSWEAQDGDDDGGDLEIDDGQAEEIRDIFLTTLPQYLEPVEQMLGQIFDDSDTANAETRNAVVATMTSLSAAASRIGFDDIFDRLSVMSDRVDGIEDVPDDELAVARERIFAELEEIKHIAAGVHGQPVDDSDGDGSRTIVSALRDIDHVDQSVLGRLTSAGLLTVDQLLMADPDEIVAVSGLGSDVVAAILGSLGGSKKSARKRATPRAAADSEANVLELAVGPEALRGQLERSHSKKTASEASLAAARAEVQRLRQRLPELRDELGAAEDRRAQLDEAMSQLRAKTAQRIDDLENARAARREIAGKHSAAEQAVDAQRRRLLELRAEREAAVDERRRLDTEVAGLVERVRRMLDNAIRGHSG